MNISNIKKDYPIVRIALNHLQTQGEIYKERWFIGESQWIT